MSEAQLSEKEIQRLKKKARPLWKKKRFIIPAALIVICIAAAAHGGGSSQPASTPTSSSTSSSSSNSGSSASTVYKVGQTFKVGEYQVTVNSVKTSKSISNALTNDTANGQFYMVNITLKNLSNTASTVDSSLFNLEQGGNKYSADTNATMDSNMSSDGSTKNDMFLNQLNPGVAMTGNLVFDVPANLNKGVLLDVSGGFTSGDSSQVKLN